FNIVEGQHVEVASLALNTSITPVLFQVEQQPGQPAVTIEQLHILANSLVLEAPADTVVQRVDLT
ncbi:MAG: hypothetical protein GWO08_11660, partial [Gammaproteobacteria bacterium]|nr:hypothetical protein [Gammaproteobacteria bacterium]NIR94287.1 hypothetical protein [Gammaproteobacteria bacterium]